MLMAVSFFIGGPTPRENLWCDDPATYATAYSNPRCGAQAFFFHVFGLASIMWWAVIAYHMFASVYLNQAPELGKREKYYHLFAWGIPIVLAIAALATDSYAFAPPAAWCYIHDRSFSNNYNTSYKSEAGIAMDYWLFYIPLGLCILASFVFLAFVFWTVFQVLRKAKSLRKGGADLRIQGRIIFFLIFLFVLFIIIFQWRVGLDVQDVSAIKSLDLAWGICKVKINLGLTTDNSGCPEDHVPRRVNFANTTFETVLAASFGLVIFVAFGSDPAVYIFWAKLFRLRSWDDIKAFIYEGTEPEILIPEIRMSSSTQHLTRSGSSKDTVRSRADSTPAADSTHADAESSTINEDDASPPARGPRGRAGLTTSTEPLNNNV
eukprot:Phypoly_transcript_08356.p1 GENE.Phypoly_transcript_08356~~Phypoly_transcript_08356.p1  ORF type:complete len:378 (+),score=54.52 Phypoly_transcript_08356:340-1473(+)